MLDDQGNELLWPAPRTFFGAPRCEDLSELRAQVAFLGVPYDIGTLQPSIRTGQSAAPASARVNSWNTLEYTWPPGAPPGDGAFGWFDIEDGRDYLGGVTMADVGDVAIVGAEVHVNLDRITEATRRIAERGALIVAVGGDHSISFPVGRGLEELGPFDVCTSTLTPTSQTSGSACGTRTGRSSVAYRSCRSSGRSAPSVCGTW